jgi:hypothetical protein
MTTSGTSEVPSTAGSEPTTAPTAAPTTAAPRPAPPTTPVPTRVRPPAPPPTTATASRPWRLTTYYTAVEQYHHGSPVDVTGCPVRDCDHGHDDLGSYPDDFVSAVKDEGAGRITAGAHAGQYLNWSYDVGYWLDTVPANTNGGRLATFHTAAADADAMRPGTAFVVTDCGTQGRDPVEPAACARFRQAHWVVEDAFTPGLGGARHVDLYIGEEDRPDFTDVSPIYIDASGAALVIG